VTPDQPAMTEVPATRIAMLQLFTVSGFGIARALSHMGTDRFRLRSSAHAADGLRFVKLLGTGSGTTFRPQDADPAVWGIFTVWDSVGAAERFQTGPVAASWGRLSNESATVMLRPLRWKGLWSRQTPFGSDRGASADAHTYLGPVASLTRARIKPGQWRTFLRAVPPVAVDLVAAEGSLFRVGVGEAPIGLQATFSMWSSQDAVDQFAYKQAAHRKVVRQTSATGWYAEEMFARFAVESATGSVKGVTMEGVHRLIHNQTSSHQQRPDDEFLAGA
jgi:hypothetical protein